MPESDLHFQVDRAPGGQFVKGQSGNPAGKPQGCRNHATRTAEALLDGEAEALTRKAVTPSAATPWHCGSASTGSSRRAAIDRCSSPCRRSPKSPMSPRRWRR